MGTQWVSMGTMGLRACFINAHCRQVFGNLPVMLWSILYTALMHFMTGSTDVAQQMETRNKSRNRSFSPLQLHGWFLPQCHFPALTSNPWFKKCIHPVIVTVIWLRNKSLSALSVWWPSITHLHWFHFNPSTFSSSHRFHHSQQPEATYNDQLTYQPACLCSCERKHPHAERNLNHPWDTHAVRGECAHSTQTATDIRIKLVLLELLMKQHASMWRRKGKVEQRK